MIYIVKAGNEYANYINYKKRGGKKMSTNYLKNRERYMDVPIKGQRQEIQVHLCGGTDIIWKVIATLAAILIAGSLVSIPIGCSIVPEENIAIFACIDIVIFWGSVFLLFGVKGHISGDKNIVFATTDQKLIYMLNLNLLFSPMSDIPISSIGRMAYFHEKGKEYASVQEKIDAFMEDREVVEKIMDELINPKKTEEHLLKEEFKKLNSPVIKKKLLGTYIKYWDQNTGKWELTLLPKLTEGYTQICELIKSRKA